MGQAVIGGIITSSILTLVVVPVIYTWLDDFAVWGRKRFGPPETDSAGGGSTPAPDTAVRNDNPV
jgi:HAE1 family hydrophobic/amphiphilic exporter-1